MSQRSLLFEGLKFLIKEKKLTYKDLAQHLKLSHSNVRRMFSKQDMDLSRLDEICEFLNTDCKEILKLAKGKNQKKKYLSSEQEKALVRNPMLLSYFYLLLSGRKAPRIQAHYGISNSKHQQLMVSLEKLELIQVSSKGKLKVPFHQDVRWLKGGPLELTYRKVAREEFWNSNFSGAFSNVDYFYSRLSPSAIQLIEEKMQRLRQEIEELNQEHESKTSSEDMFFVFAHRPWRPYLVERGLKEYENRTEVVH